MTIAEQLQQLVGRRAFHRRADLFCRIEGVHGGHQHHVSVRYEWPHDGKEPVGVPVAELMNEFRDGPLLDPSHASDWTEEAAAIYNGSAGAQAKDADLRRDLASVLNRYSLENGSGSGGISGTPDFILADYLLGCLAAFDETTKKREAWYGRRAPYAGIGCANKDPDPDLREP